MAITTLFVDIGGVLLSNGWDGASRREAASVFGLDSKELEERHGLCFAAYESGRLSLDGYLDLVVFHRERPFTRAAFREFMYARSTPHPPMLDLVRRVKARHGLRVASVNNEGRELNAHRLHRFRLREFIDFFVCSAFVGMRKPDADLYRLALELADAQADEVAYLEDRKLFVEVANGLGIHGILHVDVDTTRRALGALGLSEG